MRLKRRTLWLIIFFLNFFHIILWLWLYFEFVDFQTPEKIYFPSELIVYEDQNVNEVVQKQKLAVCQSSRSSPILSDGLQLIGMKQGNVNMSSKKSNVSLQVSFFGLETQNIHLPITYKERPKLISGKFFKDERGEMQIKVQFSSPVHESRFQGGSNESMLGLRSLQIILFNFKNEALEICEIQNCQKIADTIFLFKIKIVYRLTGSEFLKVIPNQQYCFDYFSPYGSIDKTELDLYFPVLEPITPWWLCASLYYQYQILESLEMVTYMFPFSGDFGSPARYDLPNGGVARYVASKAFSFSQKLAKEQNLEVDNIYVDTVEVSHDFLKGNRYGSSIVHIYLRNSSKISYHFNFVHDDVHDVQLQYIESTQLKKIYFITAVYGREERFHRLIQLYQRFIEKGEKFGVCIVDYQGNSYNIPKLMEPFQNHLDVIIIQRKGEFMKAPGLQDCINSLDEDSIGFILDVDIEIDEKIFQNIRQYTIKGVQIFSPIVYYENYDSSGKIYQNSPVGYATMGTGILSAFISDINRVGGYDIDTFKQRHGWEDTDFFFRIRHSFANVARFRENRMVHIPHERTGTWANSTTEKPTQEFGCPNFQEILEEKSSYEKMNISNSRIYFKSSKSPSYSQGIITKVFNSNLFVKIEKDGFNLENNGNENMNSQSTTPKFVWIRKTDQDLHYFDIIPLLSQNAQIMTNIIPCERFWPEYMFSSLGKELMFWGCQGVKKEDFIEIDFEEEFLAQEVTIRTGTFRSPNKILRFANLEITDKNKLKTVSKFRNGVALIQLNNTPIINLKIIVQSEQPEQVIFQPFDWKF